MRPSEYGAAILVLWSSAVFSDCGHSGSATTISSLEGVQALTSCSTYTGSIAVATNVVGDIALDGPEEISGDLIVSGNDQIRALSSKTLTKIGGEFKLQTTRDASIRTIKFPKLTSVENLTWSGLPNITEYGFDSGLSLVSRVDIQNTSMTGLLGGLNITSADTIYIANNPQMTYVSLSLDRVENAFIFQNNGLKAGVDLSSLTWANNLTFYGAGSISLSLLNYIKDSLGVYDSFIEDFEVPNLGAVAGTIEFANNTNLTTLTFRELKSVESIRVSNNSVESYPLTGNFDRLGTAEGAIGFDGFINSISMPALERVKGAFVVQPNNENFDCARFDAYQSLNIISGQYQCQGHHQNSSATIFNGPIVTETAGNVSGNSTANLPPPQPRPALGTGAKAGIGIGAAFGVAVLIGAGVLLVRRRKKLKIQVVEPDKEEMGSKEEGSVAELPPDEVKVELGHGKEAHELIAEHGASQLECKRKVRRIPGTHEMAG